MEKNWRNRGAGKNFDKLRITWGRNRNESDTCPPYHLLTSFFLCLQYLPFSSTIIHVCNELYLTFEKYKRKEQFSKSYFINNATCSEVEIRVVFLFFSMYEMFLYRFQIYCSQITRTLEIRKLNLDHDFSTEWFLNEKNWWQVRTSNKRTLIFYSYVFFRNWWFHVQWIQKFLGNRWNVFQSNVISLRFQQIGGNSTVECF